LKNINYNDPLQATHDFDFVAFGFDFVAPGFDIVARGFDFVATGLVFIVRESLTSRGAKPARPA
jgi:hypothetical protein